MSGVGDITLSQESYDDDGELFVMPGKVPASNVKRNRSPAVSNRLRQKTTHRDASLSPDARGDFRGVLATPSPERSPPRESRDRSSRQRTQSQPSSSSRRHDRSRSPRPPRRPSITQGDRDELQWPVCRFCKIELGPTVRRYKNCIQCYSCGSNNAARITLFNKFDQADEKVAFDKMLTEDPDRANKAIADFSVGSNGKRDMSGLVLVINSWKRERRISMHNKCTEMDHPAFVAHWQRQGRSQINAEKRWTAATTPERIAQGWAWYVGKTLWTWVAQPRELNNEDILSSSMNSGDKHTWTDQSTANRMLRGSTGIELGSSCKQLFGGL